MAGYGVANNNNETTNTQLNAELSDEDIKNTLVPIENEVSATVENLPFVPESNVIQMFYQMQILKVRLCQWVLIISLN